MSAIWYRDPAQLFTRDTYLVFFPVDGMPLADKLNAVMRLSVYFALVMAALRQNLQFLLVPVVVGLGTAGIYEALEREAYTAGAAGSGGGAPRAPCTAPQAENPFMNVLVTEYVTDPTRPAACDVQDRGVQNEVRRHFEAGLYRNIEDIYGRNASDRQFYTTPSTTIPNDQEAFVKFLGGGQALERRALACPQQNGRVGHGGDV